MSATEPEHLCPGRCGSTISAAHFACWTDYYSLPPELTAHLENERGPEQAHAQAAHEVAALAYFVKQAEEDAARPIGTRHVEPWGSTYQWTGKGWRHVPRAELDREAWERSRTGGAR